MNKISNSALTLGEKTVKGGFWVFSLRIVNRLFQLTRTIILARLLAPDDFGLFGIALLALSLLDTFSQTGFWQALIQKKGDVKPYLNTAWTVGLIRGLLIAAVLFSSAPLVASFFNEAHARPILQVIGLSIIFQNLTNIAVVYFDKKLEFHKYFFYMSAGTIADLTVALAAALILRSVWALVFGRLAGDLTRCVVSYFIHSYRPRLRFDIQKAKELFTFGKWIFGASVLIFLTTQGDDLIVGKFLGVAVLGFYQMAYKISNMTATEMTFPITKVTFPVYAQLQDNMPKLRESYLKVLQLTAFMIFAVAGLIFAVSGNFTITFLGEKWRPIIPLMRILVFQACSRAIRRTLDPLSKAIGHPEITTKVTFIQLSVLALLIYPALSYFGISGVALVVVFQHWVTFPILLHLILPKVKLSYKTFMKPVILQFSAAVVMTGMIFFLQLNLPFNVLTIIGEVILGVLIYFGISWLLYRDIFKSLKYMRDHIR